MDDILQTTILQQAQQAKQASYRLRRLSTDVKNQALLAMAEALQHSTAEILQTNAQDLAAHSERVSAAFLKRLELDEKKIAALSRSIRAVTQLPDPVGEVVKMTRRPNGLRVAKIRIPIGVICCIYESRPNVTVDIAALALKSGNACILRGGKEAFHTNQLLARLLAQAAASAGVPAEFIQFIATIDHQAVPFLASLAQYIDVLIPRGGEELIDAVASHAKMPVLHHRKGVCHIYVDKTADMQMATQIVVNAKVSNPSVCNSLEKVLVDRSIADKAVPALVEALQAAGVEVRGCATTCSISAAVRPAAEADWSAEYLDLIIAMKVVDGLEQALAHIQKYSTGLADGLVTQDYDTAWRFMSAVDSAATFVNASTRFTDGGEFGLGAEIGINTSKLHGMGPMGLEELTVTKYLVFGSGQIRT